MEGLATISTVVGTGLIAMAVITGSLSIFYLPVIGPYL